MKPVFFFWPAWHAARRARVSSSCAEQLRGGKRGAAAPAAMRRQRDLQETSINRDYSGPPCHYSTQIKIMILNPPTPHGCRACGNSQGRLNPWSLDAISPWTTWSQVVKGRTTGANWLRVVTPYPLGTQSGPLTFPYGCLMVALWFPYGSPMVAQKSPDQRDDFL